MNNQIAVPEKMLFRPDEVARLTSFNLRTIQRHMSAGEFGELFVRGRVRRITRQGLLNYLDRHMTHDFS